MDWLGHGNRGFSQLPQWRRHPHWLFYLLPLRFVDDKLSDVLLEHDIPTGSTLAMDILPDTEDVTVTHFLESSVTVMGQVSGFNGEIKVVQNSQARNVANKVVMHRDQ